MGKKSLFEAYLLAITPLGLFGGLHFYLKRPHIGLLYMCTVGVFGIGYLIDLVRTPFLVKEANMKKVHKKDPTQPLPQHISVIDAYLTWFPFGIFGLHHLYLKRPTWAIIYLVTFGLFFVGWIVDAFWMVSMVRQSNFKLTDPGEIARKKEKLEKQRKLKANETTIIQDESTVEKDETHTEEKKDDEGKTEKKTTLTVPGQKENGAVKTGDVQDGKSKTRTSLETRGPETRAVVALTFSLLGLFGAHHYYLNRTMWGVLYTCTMGLFGVGWIWDWFRLPCLLRRAQNPTSGQQKTLDDAYVLWFPWGIFGLHHFYLGRKKWGIIYMFTVGIFGLGWLMDGGRMPKLLKESNAHRIAHHSSDGVESEIQNASNITPNATADDEYDDNNSVTININEDDKTNNTNNDTEVLYNNAAGREDKETEETPVVQLGADAPAGKRTAS